MQQQPFELTQGLGEGFGGTQLLRTQDGMLNIARSNLAASPSAAAAENLRVTDFDDYLPVTIDDRKISNFSDYSRMIQ